MVQAVIFDMDGVLFDSERLSKECWRRAAEKLHLPEDRVMKAADAITGTNEQDSERIMQEMLGDLDGFEYASLKAESRALFKAEAKKGLPVKPGAHGILSALRKVGAAVGLATSTDREDAQRELQDAGLLRYFTATLCGDEVKRSKPDPDIFLRCCAKLGSAPANTFVIEDSHNGVRAGFAGGFRTIMVPDLLLVTEEMRRKTEIILPDLTETQRYLLLQMGIKEPDCTSSPE